MSDLVQRLRGIYTTSVNDGAGTYTLTFPATSINLEAADEIERLRAEVERLRKSDSDAAQYVESVICMRTDFTGDHPYVGWKGLGLALNERLDRAEKAESELEKMRSSK